MDDINKNFLSFRDAILLLAHGTTDRHKANKKYFSDDEQKYADIKAQKQIIDLFKSKKMVAITLKSEEKRNPITGKWKTQQYKKPSPERVEIPCRDWGIVHLKQGNLDCGDLWIRTPNCQYNKIYVSVDEFQEVIGKQTIFDGHPNKNDINNDMYIPPYIALMFDAISHFQISHEKQPLIEVLVDWFEKQSIEGKTISNNEAKKLASFVRLPSSQKGGNRPWKKVK